MANYFQNFNVSEMAKQIGMVAGTKREIITNIEGLIYNAHKDAYDKFIIKRARITEAKNGHSTLKVWGNHIDLDLREDIRKWYEENIVERDWWVIHPDSLKALQGAF